MAPIPSVIKLAILDDYANIAIPHFQSLQQSYKDIKIDTYNTTLNANISEEHSQLIERLKSYNVISSMRERTRFPASIIDELPNLKLLLTTGNRNAAIDLVACEKRGVTVAGTTPKPNSVKGYDTTNEQTWALILGLTKNVVEEDQRVRAGVGTTGWEEGLVSCLAGKKLGLLGLGRLGTQCAVTGRLGFGMEVIAWSSSLTQEKADEAAQSHGLEKGSLRVCGSKEELFKEADVLSVHYVLSERSVGIVGEKELRSMKPSAIVVNTSRGPLIDETALLKVLDEGRIGGAGLDVFDTEPLPKDSPWRSTEWGKNGKSRVLISPHMGYVEEGSMHNWYDQTAQNLERWLRGEELKTRILST